MSRLFNAIRHYLRPLREDVKLAPQTKTETDSVQIVFVFCEPEGRRLNLDALEEFTREVTDQYLCKKAYQNAGRAVFCQHLSVTATDLDYFKQILDCEAGKEIVVIVVGLHLDVAQPSVELLGTYQVTDRAPFFQSQLDRNTPLAKVILDLAASSA